MLGGPFFTLARAVSFTLAAAGPFSFYAVSERTDGLLIIFLASVCCGFVLSLIDYTQECWRVQESWAKWEEPADAWRDERVERHSLIRPIRVRRK